MNDIEFKIFFRTHRLHGKKIRKALRKHFVDGLNAYQACKATGCDRSQMSRTLAKIKEAEGKAKK